MKTSEYPHIIHLYTYEPHSLHIIAPLKCGTRYLSTTNFSKKEYCHINELVGIINSDYKVYFVTRDPLEHLYSALFTESITTIHKYGESYLEKLLTDTIHHWSPTLYKSLFENWKLRKTLLWNFEFINLSELSNVLNQYNLAKPYDKTEYSFENEKENSLGIVKDEIIEKLKQINPKNYFEMERDAMIERYFLYKLINKIRK